MILYLSRLLLIALLRKKGNLILRWGMALAAVFMLMLPTKTGMTITFLDVGQGECICIKNGYGRHYLVDGGSSSVSGVGEYRIIPFLKFQGISRLEAVFITHPDEDHCNGIKELIQTGALQGIQIKNLVLPDIAQTAKEEAYLELERLAAKHDIPVAYISRGQKIADNQLAITCLHPTHTYVSQNSNEYSTVLTLTVNNFTTMLTGDIEGEGEQMLTQFLQKEKTPPITILKVAHHGSKYSTDKEFLEIISPRVALISAGEDNPYGHPHSELIDRLNQTDCQIYQTNQTGAITVHYKDGKITIKSFLKKIFNQGE